MNKIIINNIYEKYKKEYYSIIRYDYDIPIILDLLDKYSNHNKTEIRILDIGCGYGKKMIALASKGYDILGVEVNHQIVETNKKQGLNCISVEEFASITDTFDIILMSHIIEHFYPSELKDFMDYYLDKLKTGGYLVIATPLANRNFYDDFDHVKPYTPVSIIAVFGKKASQVQYYSRNKLDLVDIKFRRRHYWFTRVRAIYVRSFNTKLYQISELLSALLCRISYGWLGRKDGWVGIFKKV